MSPMRGWQQIAMPLPSEGFDPTEAAVPYRMLRDAGHRVFVATPDGKPPQADPRMLTGADLRMWKSQLMADENARRAYAKFEASGPFNAPLTWTDLDADRIDALLLAGGHAQGMKPYLESPHLQALVGAMFAQAKPVAAICHGVVLVARSRHPETGKSVLHGRRTTALTRPQELLAHTMTRAFLGTYYRTYPETTVEQEVVSQLAKPEDFERGHRLFPPSERDGPGRLDVGFTLRDGAYLSARWPGDAHRFGHDFVRLLAGMAAPVVEDVADG